MPIHYTRQADLGVQARGLVEFDMGSIRQMVAAQRDPEPTLWVADPDGYERDGHVTRDSDSVRLLAWVESSGMIYATDGCNSCWHTPPVRLPGVSGGDLKELSERMQLPLAMLDLLTALLRKSSA